MHICPDEIAAAAGLLPLVGGMWSALRTFRWKWRRDANRTSND